MPAESNFSFINSLQSDRRRHFYEDHRAVAITMIVIVFFAPFAGLYVTGLFGAVFGLLLSVLAYYLTPFLWRTFVP